MPPPPPPPPPPVRVVSTRTVKPLPSSAGAHPASLWDVAMLSFNYIQKGLLLTPPTSPPVLSTADVVDHLASASPPRSTHTTRSPARASGSGRGGRGSSRRPPLLKRWSPDGAPVVLPYDDLSELIDRLQPPLLRERMLHFSAESLVALKERARQELLAAGDTGCGRPDEVPGAELAAVEVHHPRPGNGAGTGDRVPSVHQQPRAFDRRCRWNTLATALRHRHGVGARVGAAGTWTRVGGGGRGAAVAAHTDASIRARVESGMAKPVVYSLRFCDASDAVAARSGKANKFDGKTSLFPGQEGGGSMDAELVLTPEHMAALEDDGEFWAAVTPCHPSARKTSSFILMEMET
ncbi:hypothetical protein GUJ93_ZPchr0007g5231 [Zizania palustris]|uniref:Uncharacterized protein n=1 Tax=Zizania palustris TaxID=103762 RepID=A0A8J5TJV5_ZIZPA|nr:hypothetical protein GUJ93_ZPchr0007g5231 [Zizania palustris]